MKNIKFWMIGWILLLLFLSFLTYGIVSEEGPLSLLVGALTLLISTYCGIMSVIKEKSYMSRFFSVVFIAASGWLLFWNLLYILGSMFNPFGGMRI